MMYLQNPRDEHRICDSLSLRAHNSYERPDVSSSSLHTADAFFIHSCARRREPRQSQQRSFSTSLHQKIVENIMRQCGAHGVNTTGYKVITSYE
jgi:hypothetical protein